MSVSSHLQNFHIPEEFRQAPSAGFGELLGKVGDHENYTNKSQLSRVGAPPPSPFRVEGMRQVDEQLRNKSSAEDTDIDNLMEELLNDVDIDEEKSITDPKFAATWVKKYCTMNEVTWFTLYFPYVLLLIPLMMLVVEKGFRA